MEEGDGGLGREERRRLVRIRKVGVVREDRVRDVSEEIEERTLEEAETAPSLVLVLVLLLLPVKERSKSLVCLWSVSARSGVERAGLRTPLKWTACGLQKCGMCGVGRGVAQSMECCEARDFALEFPEWLNLSDGCGRGASLRGPLHRPEQPTLSTRPPLPVVRLARVMHTQTEMTCVYPHPGLLHPLRETKCGSGRHETAGLRNMTPDHSPPNLRVKSGAPSPPAGCGIQLLPRLPTPIIMAAIELNVMPHSEGGPGWHDELARRVTLDSAYMQTETRRWWAAMLVTEGDRYARQLALLLALPLSSNAPSSSTGAGYGKGVFVGTR
ncbi:hypothetical protein O3P69_002192 [Scylla paramamosain]|uniref:Uncharacterized protein n=1 Tax=Scylla paramamosain TaxID=85552 RepID=A0AAW0V565_SCYPA